MENDPTSTWSFLVRHWRIGTYGLAWLLLAIVVLQNLEPIRLDLLFWSVGEVPKLVLVLASMALGIAFWELGRRLLFGGRHLRGRDRPAG